MTNVEVGRSKVEGRGLKETGSTKSERRIRERSLFNRVTNGPRVARVCVLPDVRGIAIPKLTAR
jgi:hypothetical protein